MGHKPEISDSESARLKESTVEATPLLNPMTRFLVLLGFIISVK